MNVVRSTSEHGVHLIFTISYAGYKLALQPSPNLKAGEKETMKNNWLRFLAAAAISGGMLLAAQEVSGQPAQPAPPAAHRMHRSARIARYLNLTPAQVTQARAELQSVRQSSQPIRQQLQQVRQSLFQAVQANDTARIDQLSAQTANLKGQISAMRNEAFARIYSNLTPDQKAKADQLPAHFRQMRQRWLANHQNPNNG